MTDYDDLRRVFGDLAADPPLTLGRKEAVMSRISRRLQRQAALRGVAAVGLVALLGVGAVQTSLQLQQTGSDGAAGVGSSPTREPVQPTRGPEPSHAPATEPAHLPSAEPSRGPEPSQSPAAAPTSPASAPSVGPAPAPAPEDTTASGPLTVAVTMSPSTVATGTDTRALVTARDGAGRLLAVDIDWGDGSTFHFSPPAASCPRTTHLDGSFDHRYSAAGAYAVHVSVTSGDCAPTETVTQETHVTVTGSAPSPTPTYTNGPSQPTASGAPRTGDNPSYVYLNAAGGDADGWVRLIRVDWGDGSTTTAGEWSTSACTNAAGTDHPAATQHDGNVSHHYAAAGSHTATVTVVSVACDGSGTQTASSSVTLTQPAA